MAVQPIAHAANRIQFVGGVGSTGEQWECGMWIAQPDADAAPMTQAQVDQCSAAFSTFWSNGSSGISGAYTYTKAQCSHILASGLTDKASTITSFGGGGVTGGSGSFIPPPQIALGVTFDGTANRGPGAHGRLFLPGLSTTLDGNFHISDTVLTNIAAQFRTLLNAINTAAGGSGMSLCNVSRQHTLKAGTVVPPQTQRVTRFKLSNAFQTQRRRRDGIAFGYHIQSIP